MILRRTQLELICMVFGMCSVLCTAIGQGLWDDRRYQFTVHNVTTTWDKAEALCISSGPGVSLLTVHDQTAWNLWIHLLGPFNHNVRDYTGKYWFGFRAVDNSSSLFFWTGCEETPYDTPLVPDFTTQGECVFLWIEREVFVNTFQDRWFYGQNCSDKVPFICSLMVPEHGCFSRTCDDIIVQTNLADCTRDLCVLFGYNTTCNYTYIGRDPFCHLWTNTSDVITRTICFLPNQLEPVSNCQEIDVRKRTRIRKRYNQAPHLTQDTNVKVTTSQFDITNESQGASPFPAGDHKATINSKFWLKCEPLECSSCDFLYNILSPLNYTIDTTQVNGSCPMPPDISNLFTTKHYMYFESVTSWNSARQVCEQHGGQLLTIPDIDKWHNWEVLLETVIQDQEPWVGLHAPSPTRNHHLVWDDCTNATFVVEGGALNASCVRVTVDGWIPTPCNETYPFICEFNKTEIPCVSTPCDEQLIILNKTQCDISLCPLGESCSVSYDFQINMCHIQRSSHGNHSAICLTSSNTTDKCETNSTASTDHYFAQPDGNDTVTDTRCFSQRTASPPTPTRSLTSLPPGYCCCDTLSSFLREPPPDEVNLTVEEKIEKLVLELTVDKKNTTINRRKYTSATDNRRSAVGIGAVAGAIIFSVLGVVVLIDMSRIFHDLQHIFRAILKALSAIYNNVNQPVGAAQENPSGSSSTGIDNMTTMFHGSSDSSENIAPVATVL